MTIDEYHREFPNCAVCGNPETAVHHIIPKGMGGSKVRNAKNNWITLCDYHHRAAHGLFYKKLCLSKTKLFEIKAKVEKKREEEYVFGGIN